MELLARSLEEKKSESIALKLGIKARMMNMMLELIEDADQKRTLSIYLKTVQKVSKEQEVQQGVCDTLIL